MSYDELIKFILKSGVESEESARLLAEALVRSGSVLRFNGVVYLRPAEVAELVFRVLPVDPSAALQRLGEVEAELAIIQAQHEAVTREAQRWPRFWLNMGCAAVFLQLAGFWYLTYWELSWDVMEPVAYMLSLFYSLLAYLYFLARGSQFDYSAFQEHWTQQQLEKEMSRRGFDSGQLEHLLRTRERYRRYLAAHEHQLHAGSHGGGPGSKPQLPLPPRRDYR